jgi:hypothetical protein
MAEVDTISYAEKVRGGIPPSGWPAGCPDTVTTGCQNGAVSQAGVVEEAVARIFEQGTKDTPHPSKAQPNETLPEGYARSYSGLLLRGGTREIKVDQAIIKQEMDYLETHAVIGSFIGGKPPLHFLMQWLHHLQQEVKAPLVLGQSLGRGFFVVKTSSVDTVRALLLLTPHRSSSGLCVFQRWVAGFDSDMERGNVSTRAGTPISMRIPTWLILRNLKGEFRGIARQIAEDLGELLGEDQGNTDSNDPRYCVALPIGTGWEP